MEAVRDDEQSPPKAGRTGLPQGRLSEVSGRLAVACLFTAAGDIWMPSPTLLMVTSSRTRRPEILCSSQCLPREDSGLRQDGTCRPSWPSRWEWQSPSCLMCTQASTHFAPHCIAKPSSLRSSASLFSLELVCQMQASFLSSPSSQPCKIPALTRSGPCPSTRR